MNNKKIIKTFINHEFEQIRHIDNDFDGIRNMKITQEFYDHLESYNNILNKTEDQYIDDDYFLSLIFIKLNIINHQKLSGII